MDVYIVRQSKAQSNSRLEYLNCLGSLVSSPGLMYRIVSSNGGGGGGGGSGTKSVLKSDLKSHTISLH